MLFAAACGALFVHLVGQSKQLTLAVCGRDDGARHLCEDAEGRCACVGAGANVHSEERGAGPKKKRELIKEALLLTAWAACTKPAAVRFWSVRNDVERRSSHPTLNTVCTGLISMTCQSFACSATLPPLRLRSRPQQDEPQQRQVKSGTAKKV